MISPLRQYYMKSNLLTNRFLIVTIYIVMIVMYMEIGMDAIAEKFSLYDFVGIWGAGAVTVTYYLFTTRSFFSEFFAYINISREAFSQVYLLIFLYTAVAYTIGIILHELGKWIYEGHLLFKDKEIRTGIKINAKSIFPPIRQIQEDYDETIKCIIQPKEWTEFFAGNMCFKKAYLCLKYDGKVGTRRVDTYHSIYGLSRSLSVAFILHIAIVIFSNISSFASIHILLIFVDVVLGLIFYCKAYRFYMNWIKNTYAQYYLCIYKNEKRKKK